MCFVPNELNWTNLVYFLNLSDVCPGPCQHIFAQKLGCAGIILLALTLTGLKISGKWYKIIYFYFSIYSTCTINMTTPNLLEDQWNKKSHKTVLSAQPIFILQALPLVFLFLIVRSHHERFHMCSKNFFLIVITIKRWQ